MTHATATLLLLLAGAVAHVDAYSCSTSADCEYPGCSDVLVFGIRPRRALQRAGALSGSSCGRGCDHPNPNHPNASAVHPDPN